MSKEMQTQKNSKIQRSRQQRIVLPGGCAERNGIRIPAERIIGEFLILLFNTELAD